MFVFNSLEQTPRGSKCYFLSIFEFFFFNLVKLIIYLFLIFKKLCGHTPWHEGPYLLDQVWNACSLHWKVDC